MRSTTKAVAAKITRTRVKPDGGRIEAAVTSFALPAYVRSVFSCFATTNATIAKHAAIARSAPTVSNHGSRVRSGLGVFARNRHAPPPQRMAASNHLTDVATSRVCRERLILRDSTLTTSAAPVPTTPIPRANASMRTTVSGPGYLAVAWASCRLVLGAAGWVSGLSGS